MTEIGSLPTLTGSDKQMGYNFDIFEKAHGKEIEDIKYGHEATPEHQHKSEAVIICFTDGSKLGIVIATNAAQIANNASDVHASIMASWKEP